MKFSRSFLFLLLFVLCLAASATLPALADDWRPIDPADLALKAPTVEKDADAEAIFWEVRVDDSQVDELSLKNYIRIKVFNERGRESQSKVDLPYLGSNQIKDIAARVIKPDGSIVELKKEDIFERTIVKLSGLKVKNKSFALPSVEPGAIIEYRWREVVPGGSANHLRLRFQREIPAQTVSYYIKPYLGMRARTFHMDEAQFVKDKDGFSKLTLNNVPAFHEEAKMPPEDEVRSWVFLYYAEESKTDAEKYWLEFAKKVYEVSKDEMKVNDDVKKAAANIIGDASTPEEKLQRIYDYCRTKIKNVSDDASGLTAEEKKKLKENKSPSDTLKQERGTGSNIDALFVALAKAAGFDARLALSGNRDDMFFDKTLANASFLGSAFIAVRVGDKWQFFSPAEMYTPFGMLGWPEEGQEALITDSKEPVWVRTPISQPEKSVEKRTGKLQLLGDGTLEGDVRIEYTGHLAYEKKEYNDDDSPTEREETLRKMIKERMSTAELSNIQIENVTDPIEPFVYSFHIRVPGYAQRTGKRLFLQPAFFEHGAAPLFSTSARANEIYFHYPWSEDDHIEITLPAGFTLDNADAPAPFSAGPLSQYNVKIAASTDGHLIVYNRKFFFGSGEDSNLLRFPAASYSHLKAYFDALNKEDNHTITLKQTTATASN
jgi:hypothetical protein